MNGKSMIHNNHLHQMRRAFENFSKLSDECWAEIEAAAYYKTLRKNEYFSREGQFVKEFGFICEGTLRSVYLSENGELYNKYFFIENDFVSSSMDASKKNIVDIQALESTALICLSYQKCRELSDKFDQLSQFWHKLALYYLEQKEQKEIQFSTNSAAENYNYFKKKYPGLVNKINNYHIASYLRITPTHLSRIKKS